MVLYHLISVQHKRCLSFCQDDKYHNFKWTLLISHLFAVFCGCADVPSGNTPKLVAVPVCIIKVQSLNLPILVPE